MGLEEEMNKQQNSDALYILIAWLLMATIVVLIAWCGWSLFIAS